MMRYKKKKKYNYIQFRKKKIKYIKLNKIKINS